MAVTLQESEYEVEEGMLVSVCVSLSNEIEIDVVIMLTSSSGSFPNSAFGN